MATIPNTNVNLANNVRDVLNAAGGSVNNAFISFFQETAKINRWAKYKPVKHTKLFDLTKDDIMQAKAGLVPNQSLTVLKSAITPNGISSAVNKTVSEVVAQIAPYRYDRPTGGASRPWRLGDFRGYNTETTPPDSGATDLKIALTSIESYVNSGQTSNNDPSNIYNWEMTSPALFNFGNIGVKMGEGSNEGINFVGSSDAIPLPWIFTKAANCRLGIAIRLNTVSSGNPDNNKWIIFVGQKTLNPANAHSKMLPDISTNIYGLKALVACCTASNNVFDMVPVLVENITIGYTSNGSVQQSVLTVQSATNIYSLPSGAKNSVLRITTGTPQPVIPGANVIYTENGWSLAVIYTGQYVQVGSGSADVYPINAFAIIKPSSVVLNQNVSVKLRTGVLNASTGAITYKDYNQTFAIKVGDTFTLNGYTFYGKSIDAGVGLGIYGYQGIENNHSIIIA